MAGSMQRGRKVEMPTLGAFVGAVAAEILAAAIIAAQAFLVGTFGGGQSLGWFVLHVFLASLPIVAVFVILMSLPVHPGFVVAVAAAVFGTSVILLGVQLLGGLPSGEPSRAKFAVTAYGSYVVCLYLWSFTVMREAGKFAWELDGWKLVVGKAWHFREHLSFHLVRGNLGATQHPETAANGGEAGDAKVADLQGIGEPPQTAANA